VADVAPTRERIEVVRYDLAWPDRFRELAMPMRAALGDVALRIDHIGSTAVPGLDAKPIIDIQVSVADFDPLDAFRVALGRIGYVFRSENPERTKRYFRESPGQRRTHVHVRRSGSWAEQFALLFRDFLRAHADEAQRYAALKHSLAALYRTERDRYTEAKEPFIWELMRRADRWSQDVEWRVGASDA
jgi:GrpB-like predicted nucleotidyltransferase (UPF0157 family)